ncbi:Spy/CpxP family protein refolding chaperone [Telluria mixta]|uniref:Spy/CpxP family protein refolding chaperone n=1 Tax=Telluria mixta TaxID=34071 RepID=A0ABT2BSY5_9BURK|nr:Spy/CpxP family protein refolding chaperone [Telluria mixta]MCS0628230.1 Spy/CpxP family protein refolding chaperone [Telluria mixta]WEM93656.1 Spy/CpxP family protein refolding chaperone [Telluria mixta]
MSSRLPAAWTVALFLSSLCSQAPASATQGTGMERGGPAPMMGRHHGTMGGCNAMGDAGPGMMGADYGALDLTKEQRDRMVAIHRDLRDKQIALMDHMHDTMRSLTYYRDGKFDEQAARNAYAAAEKNHRQMFENMLDAQKKMDAVLTQQQRQQLSRAGK